MDPNIQAQIPAQPVIPPSNFFKLPKSVLISILIALAIIIPATGFLLSKNQSKTITQSSPIPTTTPDPTADWKIYIDEKLNFTIKYPSNEVKIRTVYPDGSVEFGKGKSADPNYLGLNTLAILLRGKAGEDPETVFRTGECPQPCQEKTKTVMLNNATGIQTLGPSYPSKNNYYLTSEERTVPVVRLSYQPDSSGPQEDVIIFEQMLSTFKFTQ